MRDKGTHRYLDDYRNENIQIFVNGELYPRKEANISVFDSGFLMGDGVWEGIRLLNGHLVFLKEHLERLYDGAEKLGIDIPIVAGVMPITNCTQLVRFSECCGAEIPRWILKQLQGFGDDRESIFKFGVDVVTELCDQLLSNGVPGLHFFTMNKSAASNLIWKNLGLDRRVIH